MTHERKGAEHIDRWARQGIAQRTAPGRRILKLASLAGTVLLLLGGTAVAYGLHHYWPPRPADVRYGVVSTFIVVLLGYWLRRDWRFAGALFGCCWAFAAWDVVMPPTEPSDYGWLAGITVGGVLEIYVLYRLCGGDDGHSGPTRRRAFWAQDVERTVEDIRERRA